MLALPGTSPDPRPHHAPRRHPASPTRASPGRLGPCHGTSQHPALAVRQPLRPVADPPGRRSPADKPRPAGRTCTRHAERFLRHLLIATGILPPPQRRPRTHPHLARRPTCRPAPAPRPPRASVHQLGASQARPPSGRRTPPQHICSPTHPPLRPPSVAPAGLARRTPPRPGHHGPERARYLA